MDRLLNISNRLGHNVEVRISAKGYDPDKARTYPLFEKQKAGEGWGLLNFVCYL